jgi:hypothetical protein
MMLCFLVAIALCVTILTIIGMPAQITAKINLLAGFRMLCASVPRYNPELSGGNITFVSVSYCPSANGLPYLLCSLWAVGLPFV